MRTSISYRIASHRFRWTNPICSRAYAVYKQACAVCHGLPGEPKTMIAEEMAPSPPQLFHGTGVTDDEAWESYWKVENGIRMTGMPGFKEKLNETQIWQVVILIKNADKISAALKSVLLQNDFSSPAPNPANSSPQ